MVYNYLHTVQYYETDQMQVVHHSNYIRWFEEARTDYMDKIGLSYAEIEKGGIIIPVVDVECKYKSMTRFGEKVNVETKIEEFNGVVVKFSYVITDLATGKVRVTGKSSHCFLTKEHEIIHLKKANKELFDKFKKALEE